MFVSSPGAGREVDGVFRSEKRGSVRQNIPALHASDWSVVGIYPRFLRLIGSSWEYTRASCV
eukprot:5862125-Pyramimonas_sp.AAC.2